MTLLMPLDMLAPDAAGLSLSPSKIPAALGCCSSRREPAGGRHCTPRLGLWHMDFWRLGRETRRRPAAELRHRRRSREASNALRSAHRVGHRGRISHAELLEIG